MQIPLMVVEVEYRIGNELTRTVPRHLSSTFYSDNFMSTIVINIKFNVIRSSSSAKCVYTGMLY